MPHLIKTPKKLIEVALPLDAINAAAAREKSIRHGHPSTLHLWWARRPLAAARAVIFAQMVNDPGYQQGGGFKYGVNKQKAAIERERLFKIMEDLVLWENTNNEEVLERARAEIRRSWRETCELNKSHPQAAELFDPDKLPGFHDPFAGGGALPLEAQRLGLESYASDLNPVAVTINKAMIEIPPRFAGRAPVGPRVPGDKQGKLNEDWSGAKGLGRPVQAGPLARKPPAATEALDPAEGDPARDLRDSARTEGQTVLKLEQIQKNAAISGLEPGQVVRIVTTEPAGDNALTLDDKSVHGSGACRAATGTGQPKDRCCRARRCARS